MSAPASPHSQAGANVSESLARLSEYVGRINPEQEAEVLDALHALLDYLDRWDAEL